MELLYKLTSHNRDTPPGTIREDFNRRYSECYMIIKLKGNEPQLFYIESLSTELTIRALDQNGARIPTPWDAIESIEPWLPKAGYYQLNNRCIYLGRRAARQWRRSFNSSTYLHDLRHADIISLYKTWKNPNQYRFSLNDIDEDSPRIRLTNELAAGYDNGSKKICVFFEETAIATVKPFSKKIKLTIPDFTQEIKDYLKQQGLFDWKIV